MRRVTVRNKNYSKYNITNNKSSNNVNKNNNNNDNKNNNKKKKKKKYLNSWIKHGCFINYRPTCFNWIPSSWYLQHDNKNPTYIKIITKPNILLIVLNPHILIQETRGGDSNEKFKS